MTTTKTIHNVRATEVATTVPTIDRSALSLWDTVQSDDKLTREATYVHTAVDERYPMTIRVGIYRKPKHPEYPGIGATNFSIKMETWANEVDDTSGEILWAAPVTATLAWTLPGLTGVVDVADLIDLLGNLYTLSFDGVDGNTDPNTNVVDKLKQGLPIIDV